MTDARTLGDLIRSRAENRPDDIAFMAPGRPALSYRRLVHHVDATTRILESAGIGEEDRVALVIPNGPEMAVAFLCVSAVAISAPLNTTFRAPELEFYLSDLLPKAVIVFAGLDSPVRQVAAKHAIPIIELIPTLKAESGVFTLSCGDSTLAPRGTPTPDSMALVLYTSGTTSRPKRVPLTHRNLLSSAANIATALQLNRQDRCLNVMPLFHIHGLIGAVLSSCTAGASVICPSNFDSSRFFDLVAESSPTWYTAVPTIHQAILAEAKSGRSKLSKHSLRFIRSCSAPLPPSVMADLEETFRVPVIEAYGMTEAAHQIATNPLPPRVRKPGSVGIGAGVSVSAMDETGSLLGPSQTGEVVVRGSNITRGYEDNAEANRNAFTNGWFRTGDLGYLDDDGYLFLTGRLKEIINRGGEKVSPREIDEALLEHPAVQKAVAFSMPHATLGEDIAAAVVLKKGAAAGELEIREFASSRLASYKVPSRVVIVDEIPLGPTGKIQRIGLADNLSAVLGTPFVPPRDEWEGKLAVLWEDALNLQRIGVLDNFFTLGGDSLSAARMFYKIEKTFRRRLPLATLFEAPTLEKLARLLHEPEKPEMAAIVLPIREQGNTPPFFCVHGPGGEVVNYGSLAHHLEGRAFYGIQAERLGGRFHRTIEEMADFYVRAIRMVQPKGPYLLGGFCFGGQIAYEMARQLKRVGEEVALVAMFESYVRSRPSSVPLDQWSNRRYRRAARKIRFHQKRLRQLRADEKLTYLLKRMLGKSKDVALRLRMAGWKLAFRVCEFTGMKGDEALQSKLLRMLHYYAGRRYVPGAYGGRVAVFLADTSVEIPPEDLRLVWNQVVKGGIEVHRISCGHNQMLREPHVRSLAKHLEESIRESLDSSPVASAHLLDSIYA